MSSDKLLSRIQLQINELAPALELFVDETIQPSVQDCENLQRLLGGIQENLAVYKYNKQNKELSPSFNIHARLSEKEGLEEKKAETQEATKPQKEEKTEALATKTYHVSSEIHPTEAPIKQNAQTELAKPRATLSVGINDKFRFMNELFSQNSTEYNIAIEQINNVTSWNEAEIYLNSLKNVYEWDEKNEAVIYFFSVVKKCFK
ncbi:hypothetical protein [Aurantibacillus circumpalustris]|uniref:hypothetical protein n=1 Tax=Aurantibacillus circumpalustris TaxID=3036359 RepID=UPI00295B617C|nr:hypothetical protein [Aurantibacillus circumpalustris]